KLSHDMQVQSVAFSPDGQLLASSSPSSARVFEVAAGKEVIRINADADEPIQSIAFNPEGGLLATSEGFGDKGSVRLFELPSGKAVHKRCASRQVKGAPFPPGGLPPPPRFCRPHTPPLASPPQYTSPRRFRQSPRRALPDPSAAQAVFPLASPAAVVRR